MSSSDPKQAADAAADMEDSDDESLEKLSLEEHFARGKELYTERDYDGAAQHFARALELMVDQHDELAWQAGPYYFEYGRALLNDYTSKTGVFGERKGEQQSEGEDAEDEQTAEDEDVAEPEQAVENGQEGAAEDAKEDDEEEDDANAEDSVANLDDLQIVFELLEVARVIYERLLGAEPMAKSEEEVAELSEQPDWYGKWKELGVSEAPTVLREIYVRLGDVAMEQEKWKDAYQEYLNAQNISAEFDGENFAKLGELHNLLAVCALYDGSSAQGLGHYEASMSCLARMLLLQYQELRPKDQHTEEIQALFDKEPEDEADEGDEESFDEADEEHFDEEYHQFEEEMIQLAQKVASDWLKAHPEIKLDEEKAAHRAAGASSSSSSSSSSSKRKQQAAKPQLSPAELELHERCDILDELRERIEDLKASIKAAEEFQVQNGEGGEEDGEAFSESTLRSMMPDLKSMLDRSVGEILRGLKQSQSGGFDESVFGDGEEAADRFEFGDLKQGEDAPAAEDEDSDAEVPGILPSEDSSKVVTPKLVVKRKKRAHGETDQGEAAAGVAAAEPSDSKKQKH